MYYLRYCKLTTQRSTCHKDMSTFGVRSHCYCLLETLSSNFIVTRAAQWPCVAGNKTSVSVADLEGVQGGRSEPNYFIFMGNVKKFCVKLG